MNEPVKDARRASIKENGHPAILKRMKELGIRSIPQLSERTGINMQTLYGALGGRNELTFRTAAKLAQGLGWSMEYLAVVYLAENPFEKITPVLNSSANISSFEATSSDRNVKATQNPCNFYVRAA